ncbi:MAG: M23 family metallopeptidase, partial [Acidobacteria bacterium]|nr:M23 family metallopeptidase [Acidobacteriota bacterium]
AGADYADASPAVVRAPGDGRVLAGVSAQVEGVGGMLVQVDHTRMRTLERIDRAPASIPIGDNLDVRQFRRPAKPVATARPRPKPQCARKWSAEQAIAFRPT